ncbi:MAG TPA: hypothetical protein VNL71_16925 [Chloroflexota bacterium]|nr:hypothetical protein [Chloroflexota bacterium]
MVKRNLGVTTALALSMTLSWFAASLAGAPATLADTLVTCPSSPCSASLIQTAIDGAASGDTIDIAARNYLNNATVSSGITTAGEYAGFPRSTSLASVTGPSGDEGAVIGITYRVGVSYATPAGPYQDTVTYTLTPNY